MSSQVHAPAMGTVQILIVDDHEVVREGLRRLIERQPDWTVCGTANTGREAVRVAGELRPNVVILEMNLPDLDGLEVARQIKRASPETEIVIFTGFDADELIPQLFEAGVKSFILKSEGSSQLLEAIRHLSRHQPFFTNKVSEKLFSRFLNNSKRKGKAKPVSQNLTAREREIVQLLAAGRSNKEVADVLGVSVRTAEAHRASVMQKLDLDSLAALVRYAIRNGLVEA
jgi:two-component system, NarL family, response regulator NreC